MLPPAACSGLQTPAAPGLHNESKKEWLLFISTTSSADNNDDDDDDDDDEADGSRRLSKKEWQCRHIHGPVLVLHDGEKTRSLTYDRGRQDHRH